MNRERRSNESVEPQPLKRGGATSVDEQAAAKLIEGYPLPPPDDLTVQRIWQRVASAPELRTSANRPRWLGLLAPSLALGFAVALGLVLLRDRARPGPRAAPLVNPTPAAELAAAQGGVFFSRPAERWQPGEGGQPLAEGQSLRTDASGQAVMDIPGIASILISRGTDVAIERLYGGTFLRLSRGSVVARVSKRPPNEPFFILTHGFSVKVVGTLFQVDQDANDRTAVSVREGVVEVMGADGRSWQVGAGQEWSSDSPDQLGTSAIADPVKAFLEDALNGANPTDLDRELGALDGSGAGPRAGEPVLPSSAGLRARERSSTARKHLPPPPVLLATREPAVPPGAAPVAGNDADGAELALYALGRLRQHRLRDPQGALEVFETYRRTYPNGSLLPEVDLAVLEVEVAAGHRDQALAESVRFLASHPASERTVEVRLLRGDLLRERGDCRSALDEYRQVDAGAFAPFSEDALFETAYCQRKLGDADAARESLRQYQQRYPTGTHRDAVAKALRE